MRHFATIWSTNEGASHLLSEWADKQTNGLKVRPPANGNRVVLRLFWEEAPLCCEVRPSS